MSENLLENSAGGNEDVNLEFPTAEIPSEIEPVVFQFKIIGDIQKKLYERLLGYVNVYDKENKKWKKEKLFEPLVSKWGANMIMSQVSFLVNEQTPFAFLSEQGIFNLVNMFLKALLKDMVVNYERYFDRIKGADESPLVYIQKILAVVGGFLVEVLSRAYAGKESDKFYSSPFRFVPRGES